MQTGSTPAASPQISKMDQVVTSITSSGGGHNVPKQKEQQRPLLNNRIRPFFVSGSASASASASALASSRTHTQSRTPTQNKQKPQNTNQKTCVSSSVRNTRQPLAPTTPNFHAFNHLDTESSHTSYATKRPSNKSLSSKQTQNQRNTTSLQTHFPYHSVRNQVYDHFRDDPSDKAKLHKHRQLQVMPLFAKKPAKPAAKPVPVPVPVPVAAAHPSNPQPIPPGQERYARIKPSLQPKNTLHKVTSRFGPQKQHKQQSPESCRHGVDPHDLSRRLYRVLAERNQLPPMKPPKGAPPPSYESVLSAPTAPMPTAATAVTSATLVAPFNKNSGPYVPSQAATQFARTTASMGVPRKTIRLMTRDDLAQDRVPTPIPRDVARPGSFIPPQVHAQTQIRSISPSRSLRHAYKDAQETPGARRGSVQEDDAVQAVETVETVETVDTVETEEQPHRVAPAEYMRLAQEHNVDWSQSDEMRRHVAAETERLNAERAIAENAERARYVAAAKAEADKAAEREKERENEKKGSRLHRLRARLSFSRDKSEKPVQTAQTDKPRVNSIPEASVLQSAVDLNSASAGNAGKISRGRSGRSGFSGRSEDVPTLVSPTASSPPSTTELSLTTSASAHSHSLTQTHTETPRHTFAQKVQSPTLARNRSSELFLSLRG